MCQSQLTTSNGLGELICKISTKVRRVCKGQTLCSTVVSQTNEVAQLLRKKCEPLSGGIASSCVSLAASPLAGNQQILWVHDVRLYNSGFPPKPSFSLAFRCEHSNELWVSFLGDWGLSQHP